ncbi:Uncharacterised protein [Raoultella planticola]|uniref:Uncharacterized protein n=1 Tax=Raoultella planticola TaxID=575 RepID=A0A485AGH6_RAOPL|nr:Uncharacterised protein [Raoultella planticola]
MLGNENLKLAAFARLENRVVHAPWFSLPESANEQVKRVCLSCCRMPVIRSGRTLGLVGWKLFTGSADDRSQMFDLPAFIVDAIRQAAGQQAAVANATAIFIAPDGGVRTVNSANELAHYEYGAKSGVDGDPHGFECHRAGKNGKTDRRAAGSRRPAQQRGNDCRYRRSLPPMPVSILAIRLSVAAISFRSPPGLKAA